MGWIGIFPEQSIRLGYSLFLPQPSGGVWQPKLDAPAFSIFGLNLNQRIIYTFAPAAMLLYLGTGES